MRKFSAIPAFCFVLIIGSSFLPVKNAKVIPHKVGETASIYLYRVGQFNNAASNWAIFADNVKICKLSNNKFLKVEVAPGKHTFNAKIGGVELFKKETGVDIDAEAGKSYYIACNIKQSFTRSRLELLEVTKSSADKQMANMTLDKCQEKIDAAGESK